MLKLYLTCALFNVIFAPDPSTLPPTVPVHLEMLRGKEHGTYYDDTWYVPYKDYKIKNIKMWKDGGKTSGFEVTYSVHPSYTGWGD